MGGRLDGVQNYQNFLYVVSHIFNTDVNPRIDTLVMTLKSIWSSWPSCRWSVLKWCHEDHYAMNLEGISNNLDNGACRMKEISLGDLVMIDFNTYL